MAVIDLNINNDYFTDIMAAYTELEEYESYFVAATNNEFVLTDTRDINVVGLKT